MSWRGPLELFGDIVTIMAAIVYANHLMERGLPLGALFVVFLGLVVCSSLYTLLPKQKIGGQGEQPTGNELRPLHRVLLMLSVFVLIIMDLMVKGIFNDYIREGMPMRVWPPSIYLINEKQCFNDLLSHLTVPIGLLLGLIMVLQWWGSKPNLFSLYTGFWTVTGAVLNLLESFAKASEGGFVTCLFWAQLGWLTGKFNLADIYIGIGITIAIGHLIWRLLSRP